MNYKQSSAILQTITKAKNILVNCHRSPDPDAIGSALALRAVLVAMKKQVKVVCPTSLGNNDLGFIEGFDEIEVVENFNKFDFSKFDVFVTLDSSSWNQVLREDVSIPKIETVNIDHHKTNTAYGNLNLIDDSVTSTAEVLYLVFEDWGVSIDKNIATSLMTGIIGDTGAFQYPRVSPRTFGIATKLMELGADKDMIVQNLYRSVDFKMIKFWGDVLARSQVDKKYKFFWSSMPYSDYQKYGFVDQKGPKNSAASMFAQIVKGTDFGFMAIEDEPNKLKISFRSRTGFDTSKIALDLGGGGHIYASGGKVVGLEFDDAIEKVLKIVRLHAKANKDTNK